MKTTILPRHQTLSIKDNQSGLVSFLVTMILLSVVTLIVVGFTQLTIRNREDALDKQLSTQALYAAETGVNDAIKALRAQFVLSPSYQAVGKTSCTDASTIYPVSSQLSTGVSYTCVLVTPNSPTIYSSAPMTGGSVTKIKPVNANGNGDSLRSLTVEWDPSIDVNTTPLAGCATGPSTVFPPSLDGVCPYGLLRMDIYRVGSVGGVTPADTLNTTTQTIYMLPTKNDTGTTTINFGDPSVRAHRARTTCTDQMCSATIMVNDAQLYTYYARFSSMYYDISKVRIKGELSTLASAYFSGQMIFDVTGKAQDVLRRVQVQVPTEGFEQEDVPNSAVHSTGQFCKRFVVGPNYNRNDCT